jgi:hypothetical protein
MDDGPANRVRRAKEAMIRLVKDRFGGDSVLTDAVNKIALTAKEAAAALASEAAKPSDEQLGALEAIVAFDGSRPSFLVKQNKVDFNSSYNIGYWRSALETNVDALAQTSACVGRVEQGEQHIGTAFLVTPTLAFTNRHVAQEVASFLDGCIRIKEDIYLDFGREEWNGSRSFDRRRVESIAFAGKEMIIKPINHKRIDLAVLRLSPSNLVGPDADRFLRIVDIDIRGIEEVDMVGVIGYPASPIKWVPTDLQLEYGAVLCRLLEGEGGVKRFAPGRRVIDGDETGFANWTIAHDASTINGNSGSPMMLLGASAVATAGIHYAGAWGSDRVNWAQLLQRVRGEPGFGSRQTLAEFCRQEGIEL